MRLRPIPSSPGYTVSPPPSRETCGGGGHSHSPLRPGMSSPFPRTKLWPPPPPPRTRARLLARCPPPCSGDDACGRGRRGRSGLDAAELTDAASPPSRTRRRTLSAMPNGAAVALFLQGEGSGSCPAPLQDEPTAAHSLSDEATAALIPFPDESHGRRPFPSMEKATATAHRLSDEVAAAPTPSQTRLLSAHRAGGARAVDDRPPARHQPLGREQGRSPHIRRGPCAEGDRRGAGRPGGCDKRSAATTPSFPPTALSPPATHPLLKKDHSDSEPVRRIRRIRRGDTPARIAPTQPRLVSAKSHSSSSSHDGCRTKCRRGALRLRPPPGLPPSGTQHAGER